MTAWSFFNSIQLSIWFVLVHLACIVIIFDWCYCRRCIFHHQWLFVSTKGRFHCVWDSYLNHRFVMLNMIQYMWKTNIDILNKSKTFYVNLTDMCDTFNLSAISHTAIWRYDSNMTLIWSSISVGWSELCQTLSGKSSERNFFLTNSDKYIILSNQHHKFHISFCEPRQYSCLCENKKYKICWKCSFF